MPCMFTDTPPQHATLTGINCPDTKGGVDNAIVTNRKCYKCDEDYVYAGPTYWKNECVFKESLKDLHLARIK